MKQRITKIFFIVVAFMTAFIAYRQFDGAAPFRDSESFSYHFTDLILQLTPALILIVLALGQAGRSNIDDEVANRQSGLDEYSQLRKAVSGGLLAAVLFLATFIVLMNPRDLYFRQLSLKPVVDISQIKLDYFQELDDQPEVMILGSSRTFSLSPAYISKLTGYSAFNFGVPNGNILDSSLMFQYALDRFPESPKVLLVETFPSLPTSPAEILAVQTPVEFIKYAEPQMVQQAYMVRFLELFNIYQFSEAIFVFNLIVLNGNQLEPSWEVFPDGQTESFSAGTPFERAIAKQMQRVKELECQNIPDNRRDVLIDMARIAKENNVAIVLYFSPWFGEYYDRFLGNSEDYQLCEQNFQRILAEIQSDYDNIYFVDYSKVASFGGLDGIQGFYDTRHLKPKNGELLIDAMVPLIQQGYQWAVEARQ